MAVVCRRLKGAAGTIESQNFVIIASRLASQIQLGQMDKVSESIKQLSNAISEMTEKVKYLASRQA